MEILRDTGPSVSNSSLYLYTIHMHIPTNENSTLYIWQISFIINLHLIISWLQLPTYICIYFHENKYIHIVLLCSIHMPFIVLTCTLIFFSARAIIMFYKVCASCPETYILHISIYTYYACFDLNWNQLFWVN